ncbi:conserved hypothetical protein [Leishmania major strain Friedlin]|uniref:Uncharacterized protein n=1 Tax=Leishmania major TaxID=5664 RepID=Q4QEQ9_LEIMA|nr:conserved hypothetical protein [Leishmania major strain Friedlin]CAG9572147.1 hypothetical_protein_-_conserved [Leishmania major strain Friedlin]CAJ03841.1 conserved hypothetical protein [Leishmania major strain Friedlin]|eukprot:XP_001682189.1 conserved hypothetical protein [Leishmania major strain Friedlin]
MSRITSHPAIPPPPSRAPGRQRASVGMASVVTEPDSAQMAQENITLLQALVQPTRYRRRVQPQFEAFHLEDPDYMKYNLKAYWPHHLDSGAVTADRAAPRQPGSDDRGSTALVAVQSRMSPQPLRLANGVLPSPSAAYGDPHRMGSCNMDRDQQLHCKELTTRPPPVLPGAGRRGSSSDYQLPPGRSDDEEGWPTMLSGFHSASERHSEGDNYNAGCASEHSTYNDRHRHPERPAPQYPKGQQQEYSLSSQQQAENSSRCPSAYDTQPEREKRHREEERPAGQPRRSSTSNAHALSIDGGAHRRSGLGGGGDSATADCHDQYGPSAGECGVDSSRPQRFEAALPVGAPHYGWPHVVSANGGVSGTAGNGRVGEADEGEAFEDGDGSYGDGGAEWGAALDEWDDDEEGGAAPVTAHNLYANDGEEWMDTRDGAYHDRDDDNADSEPSYLQPPPPASKEQRPQPSLRASLPAEAPAPPSQHRHQRPTRHIQRQSADVTSLQSSRKGSQQPRPVEGEVDWSSTRGKKKTRSNKHNPRAFLNRTTHTWVSTNTTTTVILPPATVQLVPMSALAMSEVRQPVDGRWAATAVLPPPSPYSLSSQSMLGYQQRCSQMEVLDDSGNSISNGRKHVGNSLPCLPSRNTV